MTREIIKYDEQFKRTVISMLESGELKSMEEARRFLTFEAAQA